MKRFTAAALLALAAATTNAQSPKPAFKLAEPGYVYQFPRDHGSHEEFRTEWWYYTGHLKTAGGRSYGFELTFFRVGVDAGPATQTAWDLKHLALAHFAITDVNGKRFRYYERLNRASRFTANAATARLHVFNEGWSATTLADGSFRLRASAEGDAIDLTLTSRKPPAIHGQNGVSVKAIGKGYASHYYSLTRLEATGVITIRGRREPVRGLAWMDHEFGSSALRENQVGWDWFSVQLDTETELMLYIIRKSDGTPDVTSSGSLILSDGRTIHLARDDFEVIARDRWRSKRSGATYPMGWLIRVPAFGIELRLRERMREQELVTSGSTGVTYWEGAVEVSGRSGSVAVSGLGYVEMTGYAARLEAP